MTIYIGKYLFADPNYGNSLKQILEGLNPVVVSFV